MKTLTYTDLKHIKTFDERFDYLKLDGVVGKATFGFDRYVNQNFYKSYEWRRVRDQVILRDNGCDLGIPGFEIHTELLVHHMNPIRVEDIIEHSDWVLFP